MGGKGDSDSFSLPGGKARTRDLAKSVRCPIFPTSPLLPLGHTGLSRRVKGRPLKGRLVNALIRGEAGGFGACVKA